MNVRGESNDEYSRWKQQQAQRSASVFGAFCDSEEAVARRE